jgi:hypothetical protein
MATFTRAPLDDREQNDFREGCRKMGFDPASFDVHAALEHPVDLTPVRRVVVVSRAGVTRSYDASTPSAWIGPALLDVGAGVFSQA